MGVGRSLTRNVCPDLGVTPVSCDTHSKKTTTAARRSEAATPRSVIARPVNIAQPSKSHSFALDRHRTRRELVSGRTQYFCSGYGACIAIP